MIDHVSIAVSDLARSAAFYESVLATIGLDKLVERAATVGFGKRYPEFWINLRSKGPAQNPDAGAHVCLRASSTRAVDSFFEAAVAQGAVPDGAPGPRPEYSDTYYAAFIRDPDGNRIEAVTFIKTQAEERQ